MQNCVNSLITKNLFIYKTIPNQKGKNKKFPNSTDIQFSFSQLVSNSITLPLMLEHIC